MYSVLIVDDEEVIRKGLARAVDWESHGFTVTRVAAGAAEALAHLGEHPVDVIITDVRMPRMSGLDLGRIVSQTHPDTKIVILSGYSNFAFAQEAINYRVFSYLLKPSKEGKIVELLGRLKTALDEEREQRRLRSHSGAVLDKTAGFEGSSEADAPPKRIVRQAVDIIDRDYATDLSLESLSSSLRVSAAHLCRLFKQELGCNFKEYLIDVRLTRAKELLGGGTMKVYEIAERVGYGDQRYFSELFKARTGMTPLEFRNQAGR